MKVFYINLDRREDRNKKFLETCPLKLDIHRFSAIDGRTDKSHTKYQYIQNNMIELNSGEYACFASHYMLWEKLLQSEDSHFLIFEDDAIFCDNFTTKLQKCLQYINNVNSILYIGGRFEPNFKSTNSTKINDEISKFDFTKSWDGETCDRTAHAYIIHRDLAKILLKELENPIWNGPLDQYITHVLKKYKLDIFSCNPLLCHSLEVASDSDIRNED
jgi:glycosyl transferase family 25